MSHKLFFVRSRYLAQNCTYSKNNRPIFLKLLALVYFHLSDQTEHHFKVPLQAGCHIFWNKAECRFISDVWDKMCFVFLVAVWIVVMHCAEVLRCWGCLHSQRLLRIYQDGELNDKETCVMLFLYCFFFFFTYLECYLWAFYKTYLNVFSLRCRHLIFVFFLY